MDQLKESGEVTYAWLGIGGQTVTAEVAEMFGLGVDAGALIEEVVPGGPAEQAGLRGGGRAVEIQGQDFVIGGDIITEIDGTEIAGYDDLIAYLAEKRPGDTVGVTYVRDGQTQQVEVTLGERPSAM
jgi:serine protease Do